jgi:uncharacterized protein (UPF0548 family)
LTLSKVAAEWRFLRGWSKEEIAARLASLSSLERDSAHSDPARARVQSFERTLAREAPGPPVRSGPYERIKAAVAAYEFSDPTIVRAHFDAKAPLLGRRMLLEIQVMGLRFLCGTVVAEVVESEDALESRFGFRYDTLAGHLESGVEWFLVRKDHETGEIGFRIEALWQPGTLPTWWIEVGFFLLVRRYQRLWHRHAYLRLKMKATS